MIRKRYSNMIIVIDEIHNIRVQSKEKKLNIYNEFHKFLHNVSGCKTILMSGTPMKDSPTEIADVMNLILPLSQQLPTGKTFHSTFLDEEGEIKPEQQHLLVKHLPEEYLI